MSSAGTPVCEQMQQSMDADGGLAGPGAAFQKQPAGAGDQVALLVRELGHVFRT